MIKPIYLLFVLLIISSCSSDDAPVVEDKEPEQEAPDTPFKSLDFLYSISGEKAIAGIHNREPNANPDQWTQKTFETTSKYPGLWSGDFLFQLDNINNRQIMVDEAVNQWKQGAIVHIMWHACNPVHGEPCNWNDGKGVISELSDEQWNELITDGTTLNQRWKAMIDEVSVYLQYLEDEGVEVLWRPLHEMNQSAFWWGGRPGPDGTRKLWQITHDYMTETKGLTNLIWVWNLQDFSTLSSDVKAYNPGDDYWDVVTLDIYDDATGYSLDKYITMARVAGDKPMGIGECQVLPTADELAAQPRWTFFMGWSELVFEKNTDQQISELYDAPNVVTLDEMDGW